MADLDQWDEDVPSFDEAWLCNEDEEPCETDENQTGVKEDIPVPPSNKGEDQVMNKNDEATKHSASWKKPLVITGGVLVMGFALIIGYQMCSSKTEEDLVLNNIGSSDPLVNTPPPNRSAAFDPLTGESIEDLADEQKGGNPAPVAAVDVEKEVDKERLAFLERERVSLRRQLQTERNRTRRLQQEARSLSAKTDQQASRIEELRSTVATLKNRPILPPGWQVVGLTTQQVIFSDGSKTYVVRVGEAVHGLKVQSVDIKNGRITTNYGVVDISRNGKS